MTAPATVPELLEAAANIVAKRGLNKESFFAKDDDAGTGPCCTDAALRLAAGARPTNLLAIPQKTVRLLMDAEQVVAEHALRDGGRECIDANEVFDVIETIGTWNDQATNDAVNVIEALRELAR